MLVLSPVNISQTNIKPVMKTLAVNRESPFEKMLSCLGLDSTYCMSGKQALQTQCTLCPFNSHNSFNNSQS